MEGWEKALVVAATGVGKTFLAAFDSKEARKILYIAHREEILLQAEKTFKCVQCDISTGYFSGTRKDNVCDVIFATVQTLGRKEYLNDGYFTKEEFDYIVIESHDSKIITIKLLLILPLWYNQSSFLCCKCLDGCD
jgi:superfamily II DNA or RNA helicase